LNTKIPMMVVANRCAVGFILSGGEASDAVEGRLLLDALGRIKEPDGDSPLYLLMDRVYEDRRRDGLPSNGGIVRWFCPGRTGCTGGNMIRSYTTRGMRWRGCSAG
jgi:hypothetical protein